MLVSSITVTILCIDKCISLLILCRATFDYLKTLIPSVPLMPFMATATCDIVALANVLLQQQFPDRAGFQMTHYVAIGLEVYPQIEGTIQIVTPHYLLYPVLHITIL